MQADVSKRYVLREFRDFYIIVRVCLLSEILCEILRLT